MKSGASNICSLNRPRPRGKAVPLMFIALDKLNNQDIQKVVIVVPEKAIGASFNDETPTTEFGFYWDWVVAPKWNLCNAPGEEGGKVNAVKAFLQSDDTTPGLHPFYLSLCRGSVWCGGI